jgi:hypothetical protein
MLLVERIIAPAQHLVLPVKLDNSFARVLGDHAARSSGMPTICSPPNRKTQGLGTDRGLASGLALLAPWMKARERVRCSSHADWPVYPRLRRTMQGSERARNSGRRGPPTRPPPRHARNHSLLADPAERISSNTPAPPHSVRNRASGRAPQPSFHQHPYRFCYYRSIGGIFLKEGFQATIKLPAPPPRVTAR